MPAAYIDRRNTTIRYSAGVMTIRAADGRIQHLPVKQVDYLVLRSNQSVDTALLTQLANQGSSVLLMDGRSCTRTALVAGFKHGRGARRIAQYRSLQDEAFVVEIARFLVARKVQAQWRMLSAALRQRPDARHALIQARRRLRECVASLRTADRVTRIRGLEGAAAAAHFGALAHIMPSNMGFTGRNRRPPRDPVNATLSLVYTLAYADAARAIHLAGLDPMLGYLHELDYGRDSLVCDLQEMLRGSLDHIVWRLFAGRELRVGHFDQDDAGCYMKKPARQLIYPVYETWAKLHRPRLVREVRKLALAIDRRFGIAGECCDFLEGFEPC